MSCFTPPSQAAICQTTDKPVYVGGVAGFDSLADPTASAALRATYEVGLYMHFNALPPALFSGRLQTVYNAFSATGNGVAEIGYGFMANPDFTGSQFRSFFTGLGQTPWAALVNAPDDFVIQPTQTVAAWQAQAEAAHALGIRLLVPVTAPNDNAGIGEDPATGPSFALMRAVALAMGGVAIDAPPRYFLVGNADGPRYRIWLVRWVHWAAAQGLRVFWIISPDQSGDHFLADTQALVAMLADQDALPHHWVVENYDTATEIDHAEITAPGAGYTQATATVSAPPVPWGVPAVARVTVKDGHVAEIGILDGGAGYLTATITIAGDGHGAAARAVVSPSRPPGTSIPGDPTLPNPNAVGRDDAPQSVAGVALWVARNAPVRPLPANFPVLSGLAGGACQP